MSAPPSPTLTRRRLLLAGAALATPLRARGGAPARTLVIGGALGDDNEAVWSGLVQAAGGAGARIAVFPTGSGEPERSLQEIGAQLARRGAVPLPLRVSPLLPGSDAAAPQWQAAVASAQGVFFSGGAQARLMDMLQPGGRAGPLLLAVQALHARGGVVAGTSSGAAVLSATAFRDAPDVRQALLGRLREGQEWDRGFGLLPPGLLVDQHFVRRGRLGRLLPLMVQRGLRLGLGVEEDSAAWVVGDAVESLGAQGVLAVDLADARTTGSAPLAVQGARLHWLAPGDRWQLGAARAQAAPSRALRMTPPAPPGPAPWGPDLLAEGQLAAALRALAAGTVSEVAGLTPAAAGAPAFGWRLRADAGSEIHRGPDGTASLFGLKLDVQPLPR